MPSKEQKMMLTAQEATEARPALNAAVRELMDAEMPRANVVGTALGIKWKGGEPTGKPAVLVLVNQKLDERQLEEDDLVPPSVGGMPTDVLSVGDLFAGVNPPPVKPSNGTLYLNGIGAEYRVDRPSGLVETSPQVLTRRIRPAEGGYSVGHFAITAGTIATSVYRVLPGGAGIPPRYFILSNNHVLANSNAAAIGDPILQPGPFDGGVAPADVIARLSQFIPIQFEPPLPRALHQNRVDAAIAEGQFHDLDREIYWTGYVRGWRPRANVAVGTLVQKTGRTTNYTVGRITAVNAVVDVNYGGGRVARFRDQIVTTNMSAGGDSGSLVTTLDDVAVGLLFAGSSVATICNQIENVRSLLQVEVAEQIL